MKHFSEYYIVTNKKFDGVYIYEVDSVHIPLRYPDEYHVRPATAADWKLLEERIYCFERTPVPDFWPRIEDHFAHEHEGLIRYRSPTGKLISTKPGRYIAKFADYLDAAAMSARWGDWFAPAELLIASTPDEIQHVYENGPESCMSKTADEYDSRQHPVRVYGNSPDLKLAYIERSGQITARALVWPEKKIHGRIYGDEIRIGPALSAAGYSGGRLKGARINRIPQGSGFVVPYIDYEKCAYDDGTWLRIGNVNSIGRFVDCEFTNGLSFDPADCDEDDLNYCEYFENQTTDDLRSVVVNYDEYEIHEWSEAAVSRYATYCPIAGTWFSNRLMILMANGEMWSPSRFEDHGGVCDRTGELHPTDDLVTIHNGERWSREEWEQTDPRPELYSEDQTIMVLAA